MPEITRDTPYRDVGPVTLATWNNTVSRYGGRATLGSEKAWKAAGKLSAILLRILIQESSVDTDYKANSKANNNSLLDVRPIASLEDSSNRRPRNRKLSSKRTVPEATISGHACRSNLLNLLNREFGAMVVRSVMPTPLRMQVADIVCVRSYKQMGRVAASAVVAPMANKKTVRYVSDEQGVGKTMRLELPLLRVNVDTKLAVSVREARPLPLPASIFRWSRYPTVESLRHSFGNHRLSKLGTRHCLTSLIGRVVRRAGDVSALPGFSLPELYQRSGYAN